MSNQEAVSFKEAKRSRGELELPSLHFVVVDNWIDVIGERALMAWLRMYSWCDRSDTVLNANNISCDVWNQASIPTSLNSIIKRLGVGRSTFYNKILKPLWNVGLIDVEDFKDSKAKGVKPINIIVYKYPQNDFSLAVKPLEKVRDYDKEYSSTSKTFAKRGGRPRNDERASSVGIKEVGEGVVSKEYGGWFRNSTGDGSKIEPINSPNSINNNLNGINKNLDTIDTPARKPEFNPPEKMGFEEKELLKENYFEKSFYENNTLVPIEISNMLQIFSKTQEDAKKYYNTILLAKKKVEDEIDSYILLEEEPELISEIVNSFSRSIKNIEQGKGDRKIMNESGYLYKTVYKAISEYIFTKLRKNKSDTSDVYYNWLEEGAVND